MKLKSKKRKSLETNPTGDLVRDLLSLDGSKTLVPESRDTQVSESFLSIGPYVLLEKLDSGGMAEVYLALKSGARGFEKQVALKCISPKHFGSKRISAWFEQEARLGSVLRHSNIVQIYDFVQFENSLWLVMEYVRGKHLGRVLSRLKHGWSEPAIPFYVISEVLKGLEYAHERRDEKTRLVSPVIHRDISPKNIMISYTGEVKIVDFGIAKANVSERAAKTQTGLVRGTPGYMAPEQWEGEVVDYRTDIFACAAVLYELLVGKPLFESARISKSKLSVLVGRKISQLAIPDRLKETLRVALTPELNSRTITAAQFRSAIENAYQGNPHFSQRALATCLEDTFGEEIAHEQELIADREERFRESLKHADQVAIEPVKPTGDVPSWKKSRLILVLLLLTSLTSGLNVYLQIFPDEGRPATSFSPQRNPSQVNCQITVESIPANAQVTANSVVVGTTPLTFETVCAKPVNLELSHFNYRTVKTRLKSSEGNPRLILNLESLTTK